MAMVSEDEYSMKRLMLALNCGNAKASPGYRDDIMGRSLICTPFDGHYGRAGWVIAVEGSPPRGVVVAIETEMRTYEPPAIFFLSMDSSRRVGSAQAETVRAYIKHLESADRNSPDVRAGGRDNRPVADSKNTKRATPKG